MKRLFLPVLVLSVAFLATSCSKSPPDIEIPSKAEIPPYPPALANCKARARAKLKQCVGKSQTAGEVSQCQTKHGLQVENCLDASRRAYERVRASNQ